MVYEYVAATDSRGMDLTIILYTVEGGSYAAMLYDFRKV